MVVSSSTGRDWGELSCDILLARLPQLSLGPPRLLCLAPAPFVGSLSIAPSQLPCSLNIAGRASVPSNLVLLCFLLIEPSSPVLQADSLPSETPGKPLSIDT